MHDVFSDPLYTCLFAKHFVKDEEILKKCLDVLLEKTKNGVWESYWIFFASVNYGDFIDDNYIIEIEKIIIKTKFYEPFCKKVSRSSSCFYL